MKIIAYLKPAEPDATNVSRQGDTAPSQNIRARSPSTLEQAQHDAARAQGPEALNLDHFDRQGPVGPSTSTATRPQAQVGSVDVDHIDIEPEATGALSEAGRVPQAAASRSPSPSRTRQVIQSVAIGAAALAAAMEGLSITSATTAAVQEAPANVQQAHEASLPSYVDEPPPAYRRSDGENLSSDVNFLLPYRR